MKRVLAMAAIVAFVGASLAAQGRNFAGSWTVDSEKMASLAQAGGRGGAGGQMRSGGGGGGAVGAVGAGGGAVGGGMRSGGGGGRGGGGAVSGPTGGAILLSSNLSLKLEAGTFTATSGENSVAYKTDGSTTTTHNEIGETSTKAAWDGDKLVITVTNTNPVATTSQTVSYYLEGESLVREITQTQASTGATSTRKTYFKKAS